MDEMEFALKVVVYSLFVEIALFVFAQAIGGTPAGVHIPAVATMVSYQNAINASAHNMTSAWNYNLLIPMSVCTFPSSCYFDIAPAFNAFISVPNIIGKVMLFVYYGLEFLSYTLILLLYMIFVFMPSVFSTIGALGSIIGMLSDALPILLAVYSYKLITSSGIARVQGGAKR